MTPLTSMKGRHKAGQLQSSEGLRIPNLAQICQRQHPGKQPGHSASSLYSNRLRHVSALWSLFVPLRSLWHRHSCLCPTIAVSQRFPCLGGELSLSDYARCRHARRSFTALCL